MKPTRHRSSDSSFLLFYTPDEWLGAEVSRGELEKLATSDKEAAMRVRHRRGWSIKMSHGLQKRSLVNKH